MNTKLFLILFSFFFFYFSTTAQDITPKWSGTINGNCIFVGNTNTELENISGKTLESLTLDDEKGALNQILVFPNTYDPNQTHTTNTGDIILIENINFAEICIPKPNKSICDKDTTIIRCAYLNWGGRSKTDSENNKTILIRIGDENNFITSTQTEYNSFFQINAESYTYLNQIKNIDAGYYSCSADVTDYLNELIKNNDFSLGDIHRFYVANIKTEIASFETPGLFSGWSLTIVYESMLESKRNIMVYQTDSLLGPSNTTGGNSEGLFVNYKFGDALPYTINDTISFGFSGFGGFYNRFQEKIYSNKNKYNKDDDVLKNKTPLYIKHLTNGNNEEETNAFGSSIYYSYKTKQCDLNRNIKYSRGFDLHVSRIAPENFNYIAKGDSSFNIYISQENEHHFLTSGFLMIGAPDIPEANIAVVPESITSLNPGEEYTCKIYVSIGENKEGLTDIKLTVPISEYIDSVTAFSIEPMVEISNYRKEQISLLNITEYLYNIRTNTKTRNTFEENLLKTINSYLATNSKNNLEYAKTNPSYQINSQLEITFPSLTIPSSIKYTDVISLTLTLKTKQEDDPIYNKTALLNKTTLLTPQAELSLNTTESKENSVFESSNDKNIDWEKYRCENKSNGDGSGNGGGGNGGGGGGNGSGGSSCYGLAKSSASSNGLFSKNDSELINITINATSNCPSIPDTIHIRFCNELELSMSSLDIYFKEKYDFDIDKIAKKDSLLWEQVKRDSILTFAKKHGVNRSQMEELLGTHNNSIGIYGTGGEKTDTLKNFLNCQSTDIDLNLLTDSIDSIINMKTDLSRLLVLFNKKDTNSTFSSEFNITPKLSITDSTAQNIIINVTESGNAYLFYDSPWISTKNGDISCDSFIVINFIKQKIPAPSLIYENDTIRNQDTLFFCKEAELPILDVIKTDKEYDVYIDIIQTPDSNSYNNIAINRTWEKSFKWDLSLLDSINTSISGVSKIAVVQKSLDNCTSDTFYFHISVSNIKLDKKPEIDTSNVIYCQSFNHNDSITLKTLPLEDDNLTINWHSIIDKKNLSFIGKGDSINVRQDSAGIFAYAVSFEKDKCESVMDTIYITVNPQADTIPTVRISICQGYELTEKDVLSKIKKKVQTDTLYWYKYLDNAAYDTITNIQHSIEKDSLTLSSLLSSLDFTTGCNNNEGYRFENIVVRAKSKDGACFGAGTLIPIKILCYDNNKPTFINGIDSVLYCVGDSPNELKHFLNDQAGNKNDKWFWFERAEDIPVNSFDGKTYNETQKLIYQNTDSANEKIYYTIRVDSNSCVSKADTFKVVVDNNINTYPMIDDTTKAIPLNETTLNLHYCNGVHTYSSDFLPTKSYPSSYDIEWYKKDFFGTDCDTIVQKPAAQKLNKINIYINDPDTTYYCVRQSTKLGCKGPWLNVAIVVHDSVREKPKTEPIILCQGSDSVNIEDYVSKSNAALSLVFYDKNKESIFVKNAVVKTDSVGTFTETNGNSLYYVSLNDKTTKCAGKLVGINTYINKKPELPIIEDRILYLCQNTDNIHLTDYTGAKTNPIDINTQLVWNPSDSIFTNQEVKQRYFEVFQKDTLTSCTGKGITVEVSIEKTFDYTPIDTIKFCSHRNINIDQLVRNAIKKKNSNNIISQTNIGYTIKKLNGNTPNLSVVNSIIYSSKNRYENDIQRFYIEVLDSVSNCFISDTTTVIFQALPIIKNIEDIVICQFTDTILPTPDNPVYSYEWKREDGSKIFHPEQFQLESDEHIRLVATTKDSLSCTDSINVYMDIKKNPANAIVQSDTFCQYTGEQILPYILKSSIENKSEDLFISWFNEWGEETNSSINTDTLFNDANITIRYTARQTNKYTGCFSDTTILLRINKAITPSMPDIAAICEPDSINIKDAVELYLYSNSSKIGVQSIGNIEYFRIINNKSTKINDEKVGYYPEIDSLQYLYTIEDANKICKASDTIWIVINKKPTIPIIENGADTVYFCKDNAPLYLTAKNTNIKIADTDIVWNENIKGNKIEVPNDIKIKTYNAISINSKTLCKSDEDSITVIIANPIETLPIGENGVLEYCTNEYVNLKEIALNSFITDLKRLSKLTLKCTKNGQNISTNNLISINESEQDTADYIFTLTDELTGCTGTNRVQVIFHNLPKLQIDGSSTICQKEELQLQAQGENRAVNYFWRYNLNGENESTKKTYSITGLTKDTTIFLIGNLVDRDLCSDTIYQKITVNSQPKDLTDYPRTFYFCQDTLGVDEIISLNRTETDKKNYYLQWYDSDKNKISISENINVPVKEAKTYIFYVKQTNKQTLCESESSEITVIIQPQIRIQLVSPSPVCAPSSFDLESYAAKKQHVSAENNILQIADFYYLENDGTEISVADPTKINKNGSYKIYYYYEDNRRCEATGTVFVKIHPQPQKPEAEKRFQIFCQTGLDTTLSLKEISGEYTFLWNPTGKSDTIYSDKYIINTQKASGNPIKITVWRKDTITGCLSDSTLLTYQVSDSIKHNTIENINICSYETVNLDSVARNTFKSDNELRFTFFESDSDFIKKASLKNVQSINNEGFYLIQANDNYSGCQSQEITKLIINTPPVISLSGNTTLCEGEDLILTAKTESKEFPVYHWYDNTKTNIGNGDRLEYHIYLNDNQKSQIDSFYIEATDSKKCTSQELIKVETNPLPLKLEDSSFIFCQNTGIIPVPIEYDTKYRLLITDEYKNLLNTINISTDSVSSSSFTIQQQNSLTGCKSVPAIIQIKTVPAIQLNIPSQEPLCAPTKINLNTLTYNSITGGSGAFKIEQATKNAKELQDIDYLTKVDSSGIYKIAVSDKYNCITSDTVKITIYEQPAIPNIPEQKLDFCQNTGNQLLTAKSVGANTKLQWSDESDIFVDSLYVSTNNVITEKKYQARQIHLLNNCPSENISVNVSVHPSIQPMLSDTILCYGSTLDLEDLAKRNVTGGNNPVPEKYLSLEPILFNISNITQNGNYIVTYKDNSNVCTAKDTLNVSFDKEIILPITGDTVICAGDTIQLKIDGNESYLWFFNGNIISNDNHISIPTESSLRDENALTEQKAIIVKAGRLIDSKNNISCHQDKNITIIIKKVPNLITTKVDTLYCQNTQTQALTLNPTHNDATIEWNYPENSTIYNNGTLIPNSSKAGTFTYKFRQLLNGCYSSYQDYTVQIQEEIKTKAIIKDTSYCQGETAIPLNGISGIDGYTIKWYDQERNEILTTPFIPSTQEVGEQYFYAKLSKGVCLGEAEKITIDVQGYYPNTPKVKDLHIFCQNTGIKILQAQTDYNATLSWYKTELSNERLDSIIILTDNITATDKRYYVSQATLKGCESERSEVKVRIVKTPTPRHIIIDTCINSFFTIADIAKKENIIETIDTLWQGKEKKMQIALRNNIGKAGLYSVSVHDENRCRTTHIIETNTYQVENFSLEKDDKKKYCYGDSVSFKAFANNAKEFIWINEISGDSVFGNFYKKPIFEKTDFLLIAKENKLECPDSIRFSTSTYPQTAIQISGETNLCKGSQTNLLIQTPLTSIEWTLPDQTILSEKEVSYQPKQTERISVKGRDANNCPVDSSLIINVINIPSPTIEIHKKISSPIFHINRDTTEITLKETALPEYENNPYTYLWDFGDGNSRTTFDENTISHKYTDNLVKLTKNIYVTLTVLHEYGCSGNTTALLLIDPDFHVPNTYVYGESIFMEGYELQIFDRIGNLIYEGTGWDGTYKGQPAFEDTYFYAITYYTGGEKNIKTGYITLVR